MEENSNLPEKSKDEAEEAPAKFCTRCGRKLASDAAYCDGCGHAQNAKKPNPDISFDQKKTYSSEKISDIIGKERDYYNRRFSELRDSDSHVCWNWYACLGWFWYAYRKMPVEAAVCFVAYLILGTVHPIGWILRLALLAVSGAFGNYIYLKHIERVIDSVEELPANMRRNAVKEYGGVSGLLLIIAFLISVMAAGGIHLAGFFIASPYGMLRRCLRLLFGF